MCLWIVKFQYQNTIYDPVKCPANGHDDLSAYLQFDISVLILAVSVSSFSPPVHMCGQHAKKNF